MIATSGFLTALECTKFVYGRAPLRTPLRELTALRRPLSWFTGADLLRGREEGRERDGRGKEERGRPTLMQIPGSAPENARQKFRYAVPNNSRPRNHLFSTFIVEFVTEWQI